MYDGGITMFELKMETNGKLLMNRLHIWHLKTQFCDQAHTDSEHVTYL